MVYLHVFWIGGIKPGGLTSSVDSVLPVYIMLEWQPLIHSLASLQPGMKQQF